MKELRKEMIDALNELILILKSSECPCHVYSLADRLFAHDCLESLLVHL